MLNDITRYVLVPILSPLEEIFGHFKTHLITHLSLNDWTDEFSQIGHANRLGPIYLSLKEVTVRTSWWKLMTIVL